MGDRGGFGRGGPRGGRGGRGGGGRGRFEKSQPDAPRVNSTVQIFVENLPVTAKIPEIQKYFSSVGQIKTDRLTKKPRIWLYHDKQTNTPTGECTITYQDNNAQLLALQTFDGQYYEGSPIRVTPSIVKGHMAKPPPRDASRGRGGPRGGGRGGPRGRGDRGGGGRGFGGSRGGFGGRGGGGFGGNSNYEQMGGGPMRGPPQGFRGDRGSFGNRGGFGDRGGFGNRGGGGFGGQGYGGQQGFGDQQGFGGHQGFGGPGYGGQRFQPY